MCPLIIVHILEVTCFQTIHACFLMKLYGHHDSALEYLCSNNERGILHWIFLTLAIKYNYFICVYIYFRSQVASVKGCLLADEQGLCLGGKYSI